MAYTGYINPEVAKMYGIPYSQLTAEQKRILHEDSLRRAKLIAEREEAVLRNNLKAFDDEAKMERVLASIYRDCQKQILADVTETIAKVKKAGGEWSYANQSALTRSRGLFEQITAELTKLGHREQITFTKGLSSIYTDQFLRQVYELGQSIPVNANFNRLNPALIRKTLDYPWSGAMFSDRLWQDKEILGRNLRVGLTQSMILGESIPQITDRINKGIDTARYNAERVARTETKRVTYCAHNDVYEDTGVEELEYRCANGGDDRTCKTCKADNRKHYKRGTEPTLPRHPNCRCVYIPVVSDTFGDNELNELTGSVRGAENYEKWRQAEEQKQATLKKEEKKADTKNESKYNAELDRLDTEYKAKELEVSSLQADYTTLETQYRGYSGVRRGLQSPEEAGFVSKDAFDKMDKDLSAQMATLKKKIDDTQTELKDLLNEKAYLIRVGAERVDTAEDYVFIRNALRKNSTFDYDKYGDDLISAISGMNSEQVAIQKLFYREGVKASWNGLNPVDVFKDGAISDIRMILKYGADHVDYREVQALKEALTVEEIIAKLGGGDMTSGSCCSLAWSYIGNRLGLDVTDYRGGISRSSFASKGNNRLIRLLAREGAVTVDGDYSDFKSAKRLMDAMEVGKEYCLQTGCHASIVRRVATGFEYLELQTVSQNGYTPFTSTTLRDRFGCKRSHTIHGMKYQSNSMLIDISALQDSKGFIAEFQKVLGYLNTAEDQQKKGVRGYAK